MQPDVLCFDTVYSMLTNPVVLTAVNFDVGMAIDTRLLGRGHRMSEDHTSTQPPAITGNIEAADMTTAVALFASPGEPCISVQSPVMLQQSIHAVMQLAA